MKNKVLYIVIGLCVLLVIGLCIFLVINHKEEVLTDAEKFKQDFEQYNGLTYEDTNESVIDISIPSDNPFIYKTGKEIVEILNNEDAYVLFGYSSCPLTRAAIETLIAAAEEENIATIYYVDIRDIRDEFVPGESIIPEQTKEGSEAYYEIVNFFGSRLDEYYVSSEDGFYLYDTGVRRVLSPTLVAVSGGKVIDMHQELVDSYTYNNEELNDEQKEELKDIYKEILTSLNEDSSGEN